MEGPRSWEAARELPAVVMSVTPVARVAGAGTRWDQDPPKI
jgi:hypothetical protein